jgi:hypothetical protein
MVMDYSFHKMANAIKIKPIPAKLLSSFTGINSPNPAPINTPKKLANIKAVIDPKNTA